MTYVKVLRVGGPIRELGHQLCLRAQSVLIARKGSIGKTRALHVIAMIERSGASSEDRKPGFFYADLCEMLDQQLRESKATLQKEESRFLEIMTWVDPAQLRVELRSNLMRVVNADPQLQCIRLALDMHVLHDLRVRARHGVDSGLNHLEDADFEAHEELRLAHSRCFDHDSELAELAAKYGYRRNVAAAA